MQLFYCLNIIPILQSQKPLMRSILSERSLVVILFIMVLVTFSFAQADSKKMTELYSAPPGGFSAQILGHVSSSTIDLVNRQ
jgi:hypothetical protein